MAVLDLCQFVLAGRAGIRLMSLAAVSQVLGCLPVLPGRLVRLLALPCAADHALLVSDLVGGYKRSS